jgi:hypothetical protein
MERTTVSSGDPLYALPNVPASISETSAMPRLMERKFFSRSSHRNQVWQVPEESLRQRSMRFERRSEDNRRRRGEDGYRVGFSTRRREECLAAGPGGRSEWDQDVAITGRSIVHTTSGLQRAWNAGYKKLRNSVSGRRGCGWRQWPIVTRFIGRGPHRSFFPGRASGLGTFHEGNNMTALRSLSYIFGGAAALLCNPIERPVQAQSDSVAVAHAVHAYHNAEAAGDSLAMLAP